MRLTEKPHNFFGFEVALFWTLSACGYPVLTAHAQSDQNLGSASGAHTLSAQSLPARSSYYGLSPTQIAERFGKADSERMKPNGSLEWTYGRSSIFFLEGKVTAWSDVGELSQRERIRSVKSEKPNSDDSLSGVWKNPWTPPARDKVPDDNLDLVVEE